MRMTKSERYEELLKDTTKYCCYCGEAQHGFGCCLENHFETFAEMDETLQEEFMYSEEFER
jgi:hypothetical protein